MEDDERCRKTLIRAIDAATRFNVPLRTVYTWYQMGKIEGIKLNGKSLRLFSESLFSFLESRNGKVREDRPPSRLPLGRVSPGLQAR